MSDENVAGCIRQHFHELLQSRMLTLHRDQSKVTHQELGAILDALIDAVAVEVAERAKR